ncbi:unnamed protein product [Caenorhabditis auriculariae]|uniref:Nuclear receptor domain-containing protein n=1 Tax=Caenorhabditis auriculariae TaxID=2777116 RepID=A0A8S1H1B5_9PELO|nr:unnamed protein product [Caenorhabditis auriculariae]
MESEFALMSYNNNVSGGYNTRRSAYLNSCHGHSSASSTRSRNSLSFSDIQHLLAEDDSPLMNDMNDSCYHDPPPARSQSPYESSPVDRPVTRKRANTSSSGNCDKRTANKICRVCGDKAFSYNFNVITCESCKAFFRRNANKEKEIRCPFNENCEINVVSRRFCQRCRLTKCLNVGMKKEWIMSDEARLEKKQRVEENRERRLQDAMNRAEEDMMQQDDSPYETYEEQMPMTTIGSMNHAHHMDMSPNGYSHHNPNMQNQSNGMPQLCHPHQMIDQIPTTGARSFADVSATTTSMPPSLDIDPATTMTSSGFIPPDIHDQPGDHWFDGPLMQPMVIQNPVDNSNMSAQRMATQAVINHQHQQMAAAVVAHQVVAQMTGPPPPPDPVTTNVIQHIHQPMQQQMLPPHIPPASTMIMNPLEAPIQSVNTEMVTIPREMLLKLVQNNTLRAVNCSCTCVCGRYPPGATIVDEVTKDLMAAGSSNLNCIDPLKDEQKLETAEDFQRNGLLPSDDSSVQWLNSVTPTVDPSVAMEDVSQCRRDNMYMNACMIDARLFLDNDNREFTDDEKERLEDINDAANRWIETGMNNLSLRELFMESSVEKIVSTLNCLTAFRFLIFEDQCTIIKAGLSAYCMVKWLQHHEEVPLEDTDAEILTDMQRLMGDETSEFRKQPGAFNTIAVLLLFNSEADFRQPRSVQMERDAFERLLMKLMNAPTLGNGNGEFEQLMEIEPVVRRSSQRIAHIVGHFNDKMVARVLRMKTQL